MSKGCCSLASPSPCCARSTPRRGSRLSLYGEGLCDVDSRKLGGTVHQLLFEPRLPSHKCRESFVLNPECGALGCGVRLEDTLLPTRGLLHRHRP